MAFASAEASQSNALASWTRHEENPGASRSFHSRGHVGIARARLTIGAGGLFRASLPASGSRLHGYRELPPCEETFDHLARTAPDRLIQLIRSRALYVTDLTFAAEALSGAVSSPELVRALYELLEDPSPLVREGAVYGLAGHLNALVTERLQRAADQDSSSGVRGAIEDVLSQ